MSQVPRILDANANRAREALRVMEEAARFILDDPQLSSSIKSLRHDLTTLTAAIPGLHENRDTPNDAGRELKTPTELRRESVADVAAAAGKRLSEALRSIEEYAKVLGESASNTSRKIESLRYRGYDIEQKLNRRFASARPGNQWKLCALVSQELCPRHDWWRIAESLVHAAASRKTPAQLCIQLREKNIGDSEFLARATRLVKLCRPAGVAVIVNDRPDIALLSHSDGVHLGQDDLPCSQVRKLVGRQILIGVSTSNLHQAHAALHDGADYCGLGPMFNSSTKIKDHLAGLPYLKEYLAWAKLPHLAISGINPANIRELVAAGVKGVAVSSAICKADSPAQVVNDLLSALD